MTRPSLKHQLAARLKTADTAAAPSAPAPSVPAPRKTDRPPVAESEETTASTAEPWPDPLAAEALHGLAGDVVRTIEPQTEADPVALLVQFLVAVGNVIGRTAHFTAEASQHYGNLFAVLVGQTSKGRKGSSWAQVGRLFVETEQDWHQNRVKSGLSSGEGLIWSVRDPIVSHEPIKEKGGRISEYQDVIKDPGEADKRLLVIESEFASTLKVMGREGNNLSAVVRQAWDTGTLRTLTKNSPAKATGAHISIVGHITRDELRRYLTATEQTNGFGNRFLWVCVRRSKALPDGGNLPLVALQPLVDRLQAVLEFAADCGELHRDDEARALWHSVYEELSEGRPGMLGGMLSRAEAQVMRLALLYAVLDCSGVIRVEHLTAALALWEYCEQSARYCFGDALGDRHADAIRDALRQAPDGLPRNEIRSGVFSGHISSAELDRALAMLEDAHIAHRRRTVDTGGRPEERWLYGPVPA